jgi:hypothetical protein
MLSSCPQYGRTHTHISQSVDQGGDCHAPSRSAKSEHTFRSPGMSLTNGPSGALSGSCRTMWRVAPRSEKSRSGRSLSKRKLVGR